MTTMFKKIILFLLILLTINFLQAQNNYSSITIKNQKGDQISFDSVLNSPNPIIISFWATWCSPCISELDNINDELEDWKSQTGVSLYAVTIDDTRSQNAAISLAKGKGWEIPILFDANQDLKRALNVANIPHIFIFYKGKLAYQHTGYTPGGEKKILAAVKKIIQPS